MNEIAIGFYKELSPLPRRRKGEERRVFMRKKEKKTEEEGNSYLASDKSRSFIHLILYSHVPISWHQLVSR